MKPLSASELDECRRILCRLVERKRMPVAGRRMSRYWRDQRSFMITEGPTEVLRTALAKLILREGVQ